MTEAEEWQAWTGILNEAQARQLVKTWAKRSENPQSRKREEKMAAKNLYVVTMPATLTVVVEAAGDKDAKETAAKTAEMVFGKSLGVLSVVGEAKAAPVPSGGGAKGDKKASKAKDEDEEEDDDEEEDEEEEEEEEADDEDEEEEEDDEDEEEEEDDEDEEPVKKKSKDKKVDKKVDKSEGKKKIKIKLKG